MNELNSIIEIIKIIRSKITDQTDPGWGISRSIHEITKELDSDLQGLENGDLEKLKRFDLYFAPTGLFQEMSMENGWAEEYLVLSQKFDALFEKINNKGQAQG